MKAEEQYFASTNATHSDSTMNLILNTEDLLKEMEVFLKGYYLVTKYDKETGETIYDKVVVGEEKANRNGVNSIMMWLKSKMTPLVSMGNISTDQYGDYLWRARVNLASNLMKKRHDYEISLSSYTEIIDTLMESFEAFFTSSIRGGHRNAITRNTTVESKEIREQEKKKMFGVI